MHIHKTYKDRTRLEVPNCRWYGDTPGYTNFAVSPEFWFQERKKTQGYTGTHAGYVWDTAWPNPALNLFCRNSHTLRYSLPASQGRTVMRSQPAGSKPLPPGLIAAAARDAWMQPPTTGHWRYSQPQPSSGSLAGNPAASPLSSSLNLSHLLFFIFACAAGCCLLLACAAAYVAAAVACLAAAAHACIVFQLCPVS